MEKNHSQKKRILWVDYVKGMAIILMIFAHLPLSDGIYNDYVYCFHMPVFFLVSGFFASNSCGSFVSVLKKNVRQLLIPYILLYLLTIPLSLIPIHMHPSLFGNPSAIDLLWKPIVGLLLGEYVSYTSCSIYTNGALWFLVALFWVRCFAYFLIRCGIKSGLLISFILSFLLWLIEKKLLHINIYWSIDSAVYACPFYLIGYYLYSQKMYLKVEQNSKLIFVLISILFFVVVFFLYKINGRIDICPMNVGSSFVLSYVNALFGSFALIFVCMSIPSCQLLAKLGRSSLIILALNGLPVGCLRFIFKQTMDIDYNGYSLLQGIVISVLAAVSLVPVYAWLQKHFQILLGR